MRAIQRTQFRAKSVKNYLNAHKFLKHHFCFETEGVTKSEPWGLFMAHRQHFSSTRLLLLGEFPEIETSLAFDRYSSLLKAIKFYFDRVVVPTRLQH